MANGFLLFVYGTLKRGQRAHLPLCATASFVGDASVRGELRLHRDGYPVLVVPEADILAKASGDPIVDATLGDSPPAQGGPSLASGPGPWRRIRGEVLAFPAPYSAISAIDAYEGAQNGAAQSTYRRVLVPLEDAAVRHAWAFAATPQIASELPILERDSWPA